MRGKLVIGFMHVHGASSRDSDLLLTRSASAGRGLNKMENEGMVEGCTQLRFTLTDQLSQVEKVIYTLMFRVLYNLPGQPYHARKSQG